MGDPDSVVESASDKAAMRRLTTVVAADICGYSSLAESDEAAAVKTVEIVYAVFAKAVAKRRGRIFHQAGDGFLAEFPSAADGVLGALEFTADIRARDTLSPANPAAKVRVGVHVGDVIEKADGDLLGHGVNVAARLQGEAEPGGVLISLNTVNLVRGKIDVQFRRRGPMALKNIDEPVVAFDAIMETQSRLTFTQKLPKIHWRKVSPNNFILASILLLLISFLAVDAFLHRNSLRKELVETANQNARAEQDINALTAFIIDLQPAYSNQMQILATRDVVKSLLGSTSEEERRAIAQIKAGDLDAAAATLDAFYKKLDSNDAGIEMRVQTLKQIGTLLYFSQPNRARAIFEKVLAMTDDSDVDALFRISDFLLDDGKADLARDKFEKIMKVSRITGDERLYANAVIGRGRTRNMVGLLEDARTDFLEAYGIADQSGWYDEASRSLLFLGTNAYLSDDLDSAEAYYRKALSMESQESSDNRHDKFLTETHFSLGTVLSDQGRLKEAAVEYEAALQISEKQHDVINIASALYNLGSLQLRQNDYFGAEKTLMRAIKVARQIDGSTNLKMHIYASLVRSSELRGDAKSACEHLYVAQKLYFDSAHHVDELEQLGTGLDCETIDL